MFKVIKGKLKKLRARAVSRSVNSAKNKKQQREAATTNKISQTGTGLRKSDLLFVCGGFFVGVLLSVVVFKFVVLDIVFGSGHLAHNDGKVKVFVNSKNYIKQQKNEEFSSHGSGEIVVQLLENDNLFSALVREGFARENINDVLALFYKKVDLRSLKTGQQFVISYNFETTLEEQSFSKSNKAVLLPAMKIPVENRTITKMTFKQSNGMRYVVEQNEGGYILHIIKPKLIVKTHVINGTIQNNLFTDAMVGDIKASTLYNVLNEYAFLIDFQRDLHRGDKFIFVLETTRDSDDDVVDEKVLYSNLILSGRNYEVFKFDGRFYDRKGKSIQKNLLRTPVDGARITSGFTSRRKHPILGYTRAHKGVDMAAPTGTPIYAAGDGVIAEVQLHHPAYGKFVLIRHNREYSTKYAHMSRVARVRVGQPVKQRQIIGYVGMTGLATGPHLHYEVIRYGKHINPRSIKAVATKQLENSKMKKFDEVIAYIDEILAN